MSTAPALDLPPFADRYLAEADQAGEAAAANHGDCARCTKCPCCLPIHLEMLYVGTALLTLKRRAPGLPAEVDWVVLNTLTPLREWYAVTQRETLNWFAAWRGAQAQVNALAAANPWLGSGSLPIDTTHISLTPRDGWIEVRLGAATRLWVSDPAHEAEARQLAPMFETQQAYEAAVVQANQAEVAFQRANARFRAADAALQAAEVEVPRWADEQLRTVDDTITAWTARLPELDAEFARCLQTCCRDDGDAAEDDGPANGLIGSLLGALGIVAGAGMVMLGQPFDTGSGNDSLDAEPVSVQATDAVDELVIDFTAVDSPYRTSFLPLPLDDYGLYPGVLGDPIDVTGVSAGTLLFDDGSLDNPVDTLLGGFTTGPTDVVFPPTGITDIAEGGVFVVAVELGGDVLAPSFCDGRLIQFTTAIDNPLVPGLYTEAPFEGDYGLGTNTVIRHELTDCTGTAGFVDMIGDDVVIGGDSAAGGIITTNDDGTSQFLGLIPTSYAPPDSTFRLVMFETQSNTQVAPDNTRYQSFPDPITNLFPVADFPFIDIATRPPSAPPAPDPDETDPILVALGLLTSAAGAASLGRSAASGGRRREDGEAEPSDPEPTVTGPPPGQADLDTASAGLDDASLAARDEMLRVAKSRADEAALLYEEASRDVAELEASETEEGWVEKATDALSGTNDSEQEVLTQARSHQAAALDAYRTAISEYLAAGLLTVAPFDRPGAHSELTATFPTEDDISRQHFATVERGMELDDDDPDRTIGLAVAKARLTTTRIAHEALAIAATRIDPTGAIGGYDSTLNVELEKLQGSIASTAEQRVHQPGETEANYRAREWFRDTRRTLEMQSLIVIAEQGTLVDEFGVVVDGKQRSEFVNDRLLAVAGDLDASAWRTDDSREFSATELREHASKMYGALHYLGNGTVSMPDFFRATSATIRSRQDDVNNWFVSEYLGLPVEDGGGWWDTIKVGWSVRLGTQGRTRGYGESSIEVVRSRIRRMNLQADRAVEALTAAAATMSPSELTPPDRELLSDLGYITTDAGGASRYRMPVTDSTAGDVTSIDKPGASWLDVVSVQNAGEVLVSVALPELAAVRMSAIAARLGLSSRAIIGARIVTDQTLGLAADVGFTMLHDGGSASVGRVVAESLVSSWVGVLANKGTTTGVELAFDTTPMKRLLADPTKRRAVLKWTASTLEVGDETLVNLALTAAQGHDISQDDVLAAIVSSAMNRAVGSASRRVVDGAESTLDLLPRDLREASVVLAPTLGQADAIDASLNRRAATRFDAVVGDASLDRSTGRRVFEALRTGELSWSELQRVFSARGKPMMSVMDQVRIERDRFVSSVVVRARARAVDMINSHFDERVAATRDTTEQGRLERARRTELDKIDPVEGHRPGTSSRYAQKALEIMSVDRDELLRQHGDTIGEPGDRSLDELRRAALDGLMTDVIQPGSAGPTSDIDRSWVSEWLRRGAQSVVEADMTHGRMTGELAPTTAAAFDTNEYNNVMTMIKVLVRERALFEGRPTAVVRVVAKDAAGRETVTEVGLDHGEVVEANSLAAAMLHMHPDQRTRFRSNVIATASATGGPKLEAMFTHAEQELAASVEALDRYTKAEAERLGTDVSNPDTQLRARDRLYGDRMAALDALGTRINELEPGDPDRGRLMSEYEREMNTALRDGIETYSDGANLDIIVSRMQSQRTADGRKLTPTELMRSDDFSLEPDGALSHLSKRQVRSMLNDQTLMIMHHVNAHRAGSESPHKATRSLAKYVERSLLALNLLGQFDPDVHGPYSTLFGITSSLMPHKDDSQALMRALVAAAPKGTRTQAEAVHWFLGEIETLPGLEGLTRGPAFTVGSQGFQSTLAARDWARRSRETGAGAEMLDDLTMTIADLETLESLAPFVPAERYLAAGLISSTELLNQRMNWLAGSPGAYGPGHRRQLASEFQEAFLELERMRARGAAYHGPDPHREVIQRLRVRADALRTKLESLTPVD